MNIAVDLGGTNVRVGLVDGSEVVRLISEPCQSDKSESEVVEQIASMIEKLFGDDIKGIGVGVPSIVDVERGIIYDVVAIPSWKRVELKKIFETRFGVPVYINNDCNCFALGVSKYGEGKGYKEVVGVTLGTGVGCSIVIDGRLYCGHNTGAGEIGNIPYLDRDYEFYCSSRFFLSKGTTGKKAEQDMAAGDPKAISLMQEFGMHIGKLVKLILYAYDPQVIVFGGSISNAFEFFKDGMYKELESFAYGRTVSRLHICRSEIPNIAILGASSLCE